MTKEYLTKLIEELCREGEDKDELSMWLDLYDAMSEEEQKKLIENLQKELEDLKNLK